MKMFFLHGLDSSSKGTKARWFKEHFPAMVIPDFTGSLDERMKKLNTILAEKDELVLIGSSFGGLMASIYALENENRIKKIILLAPALNFPDFSAYKDMQVNVPAVLFIGRQDTVCPPDSVIPAAQNIFTDLSIHVSDDDHLLRNTFTAIDWVKIIKD